MTQAHQLYAMAMKADERFQAECVRQFGASNAGTWRYVSKKHDAATRAACEAYQIAIDCYLFACRASRSEVAA